MKLRKRLWSKSKARYFARLAEGRGESSRASSLSRPRVSNVLAGTSGRSSSVPARVSNPVIQDPSVSPSNSPISASRSHGKAQSHRGGENLGTRCQSGEVSGRPSSNEPLLLDIGNVFSSSFKSFETNFGNIFTSTMGTFTNSLQNILTNVSNPAPSPVSALPAIEAPGQQDVTLPNSALALPSNVNLNVQDSIVPASSVTSNKPSVGPMDAQSSLSVKFNQNVNVIDGDGFHINSDLNVINAIDVDDNSDNLNVFPINDSEKALDVVVTAPHQEVPASSGEGPRKGSQGSVVSFSSSSPRDSDDEFEGFLGGSPTPSLLLDKRFAYLLSPSMASPQASRSGSTAHRVYPDSSPESRSRPRTRSCDSDSGFSPPVKRRREHAPSPLTSQLPPASQTAVPRVESSPSARASSSRTAGRQMTSGQTSPIQTSPVQTSPIRASPNRASYGRTAKIRASPNRASSIRASPNRTSSIRASPNRAAKIRAASSPKAPVDMVLTSTDGSAVSVRPSSDGGPSRSTPSVVPVVEDARPLPSSSSSPLTLRSIGKNKGFVLQSPDFDLLMDMGFKGHCIAEHIYMVYFSKAQEQRLLSVMKKFSSVVEVYPPSPDNLSVREEDHDELMDLLDERLREFDDDHQDEELLKQIREVDARRATAFSDVYAAIRQFVPVCVPEDAEGAEASNSIVQELESDFQFLKSAHKPRSEINMLPSVIQTVDKARQDFIRFQKSSSKKKYLNNVRRDKAYRFANDIFSGEAPPINTEFVRSLDSRSSDNTNERSFLVSESDLKKFQTVFRDLIRMNSFSQSCLLTLKGILKKEKFSPSNPMLFERVIQAMSRSFVDATKRTLLLDNFALLVRRGQHAKELPPYLRKFEDLLLEGKVDEKWLFDPEVVSEISDKKFQERLFHKGKQPQGSRQRSRSKSSGPPKGSFQAPKPLPQPPQQRKPEGNFPRKGGKHQPPKGKPRKK